MTDQKRGGKTKYRLPQSWRSVAAALLVMTVLISGICTRYFSFVSRTVYQESTSHLSEILHKSNNMLNHLVSRNRMLLHLWGDFLDNASSEEQIRSSLNEMKGETGCAALFFLASDGSCMTPDGETGSLGSQVDLNEPFSNGEDIVLNAVMPGKPQMLVFICPETQGTYRGFAYDAVAIAYYNNAVLNALDNTAFGGADHSYVIYPDGRVVLDSSADSDEPVYNLLAELREHSDLTAKQFDALSDDLVSGRSGSLKLTLRGTRQYLVYESTGIQNWSMLSLVPVSIVNASMDRLWFRTVEIVTAVMVLLAVLLVALIVRRSRAALRRRDTDILCRDELFNRLSHNVDDVFLMLDGETWRTDYISPNIERLLGLPLEQVRQDVHILATLHTEGSPDHDRNFLEGIQRGEQREWDADYIHQETGERRWFHIVAMGAEVEGRTKYILVMSDRTADREVNQALSDAVASAESASRAKSDFLTNMSHDIRTPMNAIIGFTNIALHQDSVPEMHNCLKKIEDSSDHLLALLNDVLDLSRIESGKVEFSPVPADITAVTDSVIEIMNGMLLNRELNFEVHREPLQNPYVMTEPVRIREILVNILNNAVKFTKDGGTIRFDAGNRPGADAQHIVICYRIKDTGVGMSEDFQKKLFDEFAQEENGARTQYKGTGLGMPISKKYVELMGGTITVDSRKGVGTTFTVEIPMELTSAEKVEKTKRSVQNNDLKGIKVLLAEDNDLNAELATLLLEDSGMTVTRAADGQEVVDLFANHPVGTYDVILMDIMMPKMDGHHAAKAIRAMYADRPDAEEIPIIALSANAFSEDVQASLDAGMNGHVSKPLNMEEVTKAIERNLNRP